LARHSRPKPGASGTALAGSASTMVLGGGTVTTPSSIGHIGGAATKPSQLA
jgi:hypothetical protein